MSPWVLSPKLRQHHCIKRGLIRSNPWCLKCRRRRMPTESDDFTHPPPVYSRGLALGLTLYHTGHHMGEGIPRREVFNIMDCDIVVSESELRLIYNVHFWNITLRKDLNLFPVIGWIVSPLFFWENGFGLK